MLSPAFRETSGQTGGPLAQPRQTPPMSVGRREVCLEEEGSVEPIRTMITRSE